MGPVSPVTKSAHCASTAASVGRSTRPARSSTSAAGVDGGARRVDERPIAAARPSAGRARRGRRRATRRRAEAVGGPLLDLAPAAGMHGHERLAGATRLGLEATGALPRGDRVEPELVRRQRCAPAADRAVPRPLPGACAASPHVRRARARSSRCAASGRTARVGQQRSASRHARSPRGRRARARHQEVGPDVALEVDRQVVVPRAPAGRLRETPATRRRPPRAPATGHRASRRGRPGG